MLIVELGVGVLVIVGEGVPVFEKLAPSDNEQDAVVVTETEPVGEGLDDGDADVEGVLLVVLDGWGRKAGKGGGVRVAL